MDEYMEDGALKISASQQSHYPWTHGIEIRLATQDFKKHAKEIVWENHEEGTYVPVLFCLEQEQAQTLMDQLWDCGIRPTQGAGSAGALAATERHLADLQKIVFSKGEISND